MIREYLSISCVACHNTYYIRCTVYYATFMSVECPFCGSAVLNPVALDTSILDINCYPIKGDKSRPCACQQWQERILP
jgi:ribosomal protein S27E